MHLGRTRGDQLHQSSSITPCGKKANFELCRPIALSILSKSPTYCKCTILLIPTDDPVFCTSSSLSLINSNASQSKTSHINFERICMQNYGRPQQMYMMDGLGCETKQHTVAPNGDNK